MTFKMENKSSSIDYAKISYLKYYARLKFSSSVAALVSL